MDKSFQIASWRVRPLNKAMIDYGLSDSYLLLVLFWHMMREMILQDGPDGDGEVGEVKRDLWELRTWVKSNNLRKWVKLNRYSVGYVNSLGE